MRGWPKGAPCYSLFFVKFSFLCPVELVAGPTKGLQAAIVSGAQIIVAWTHHHQRTGRSPSRLISFGPTGLWSLRTRHPSDVKEDVGSSSSKILCTLAWPVPTASFRPYQEHRARASLFSPWAAVAFRVAGLEAHSLSHCGSAPRVASAGCEPFDGQAERSVAISGVLRPACGAAP